MKSLILVTGATGFIGSALVSRLAHEGFSLRACVRKPDQKMLPGVEPLLIPDISSNVDWKGILSGVKTVIHTAARVHLMQDTASNPLAEFRKMNVDATLNLARRAAE